MSKINFKDKYIKKFGIVSMEVADDCKIITAPAWMYLHRKGDTSPIYRLRKKFVQSYEQHGEKIDVRWDNFKGDDDDWD